MLASCVLLPACTTPGDIQATDIKAFSSDGCSRYPDGTPSQPEQWKNCCIAHDKDYWAGGGRLQRVAADNALKRCVTQSGGGVFRANLMWLGVRFGGVPWYPSPFRWAYGWPYYRGYKAITPTEQAEIDRISPL